MKELKVSNLKKDEKLIYYIKELFPNIPTSTLHKVLRNKDIKINGRRICDANYILKNNDKIELYIDDYLLYGFPKDINIQYEDENILVVYKPQGILSNNESENISEPTFEDFIKKKLGQNINICHRLDRNTAGLLIFSKNLSSYENMIDGFKNGYINKEYTAYVAGTDFEYSNKRFETYLLKNEKDGFSKIFSEYVKGAQKIITDIYVEKKNKDKNYSILKVTIHTGKTHQIRAQLAAISHPIIGDSKYGKNEINKKFKKYKQLLFATKYSFSFPINNNLYYLNNIVINLNKTLFENKI